MACSVCNGNGNPTRNNREINGNNRNGNPQRNDRLLQNRQVAPLVSSCTSNQQLNGLNGFSISVSDIIIGGIVGAVIWNYGGDTIKKFFNKIVN